MKLICALCGEVIDEYGIIYEGKTYHDVCFKNFEDERNDKRVFALSKEFDRIDYHILEELFEPYANMPSGLEFVREKMNWSWCVIVAVHGDNVILHQSNTKKGMLNYLVDEIETALMEGYCFEVLYILKKGKFIKSTNQIDIKVSLI